MVEEAVLRLIHQFRGGVHAGTEARGGGIIAPCMDALVSNANVRRWWAPLDVARGEVRDWEPRLARIVATGCP